MLHVVIALSAAFILMLAPGMANADSREAARNAQNTASELQPGSPAPDFTATDSNGKTHKLSDLKGKIVVLEWTNKDCPYVRKFYDSNTMQTLQKNATDKGVVWLSVASSAAGKQGYMDAGESNRWIAQEKSKTSALLLDPEGTMGRLYEAATTPHMFVIDKDGILAYAGAIDDQPSVSHATLKDAKNYVTAAVDSLLANQPVETPTSKPYGCSVKY